MSHVSHHSINVVIPRLRINNFSTSQERSEPPTPPPAATSDDDRPIRPLTAKHKHAHLLPRKVIAENEAAAATAATAAAAAAKAKSKAAEKGGGKPQSGATPTNSRSASRGGQRHASPPAKENVNPNAPAAAAAAATAAAASKRMTATSTRVRSKSATAQRPAAAALATATTAAFAPPTVPLKASEPVAVAVVGPHSGRTRIMRKAVVPAAAIGTAAANVPHAASGSAPPAAAAGTTAATRTGGIGKSNKPKIAYSAMTFAQRKAHRELVITRIREVLHTIEVETNALTELERSVGEHKTKLETQRAAHAELTRALTEKQNLQSDEHARRKMEIDIYHQRERLSTQRFNDRMSALAQARAGRDKVKAAEWERELNAWHIERDHINAARHTRKLAHAANVRAARDDVSRRVSARTREYDVQRLAWTADCERKLSAEMARVEREAEAQRQQIVATHQKTLETLQLQHATALEDTKNHYVMQNVPHDVLLQALKRELDTAIRERNEIAAVIRSLRADEQKAGAALHTTTAHRSSVESEYAEALKLRSELELVHAQSLVAEDEIRHITYAQRVLCGQLPKLIAERDSLYIHLTNAADEIKQRRISEEQQLTQRVTAMQHDIQRDAKQASSANADVAAAPGAGAAAAAAAAAGTPLTSTPAAANPAAAAIATEPSPPPAAAGLEPEAKQL